MPTLEVEVQCVNCNATYIVTVPRDGYRDWLNGTHIQTAMPQVSAAERELLMSGICGVCFDKMFGEDDE